MSSLCRFYESIIVPVHQTQRIVKQFKCLRSLVAQTKQFKLRNSMRLLDLKVSSARLSPSTIHSINMQADLY